MKYRLGTILVVPFWSQSDNLNADSNYVYLRVILPLMEQMTEDTLFLVLFPDPKRGADKWRYKDEGLRSERIRFIPWPYDTAMLSSIMAFDADRFLEIERLYAPQTFWLHQVEMGTFFFAGYWKSYAIATRPVLIAQHHYIIDRSLPYAYETLFGRQWLQIGGSLAADRVVFNSQYCYDMMDRSFGEFLTADKLESIKAKAEVLKFGLVTGNEPMAPPVTNGEGATFVYNHRFESYKNPQKTFGMFERLRAAGHHFEIVATQASSQATGGKKAFHFDRQINEPSREGYLNAIALPGVNVSNSQHETFCISMMDSIALGQLPVAPRAVTFPELVPQDYPFLFSNENDQYQMLDHILSTWPDEYNRWRIPLAEHARSNFNAQLYAENYLSLFDRAEQAHRSANLKDKTVESLRKIYDMMKPGVRYPPSALDSLLLRVGHFGFQAMPPRRVVRELLDLGCHLVWENGVMVYRD